ncbi:DUF4097 family beta strand repeat-containing protein [Kribbella sp. CA-293567]|uniref:DUF4097 family beta strand repeat-containing protein n=1 Tax=Kribbella sp. CA-293567 TaxID=3002436 RepID=UPI0022DD92FD|nr:DUF4097 family beta strand repeat-containing protein [Kribbella sp. CA-293567]WBQ05214.1 DUF4097 family beta strand repeat-containing protein [Kribbella sp. CA-293567]
MTTSQHAATVTAASYRATTEETTMHTFDTPAPIAVALDIPAGRVTLIATDRPDTTVEILPADPTKSRDSKLAEQTKIRYADGVLRIEATTKHQLLGSSGSIDVTVHLPTGSQLEAKAASAELRATGRFAGITFEGAHGAIHLDEATSVRLTTHAGDVSIGRLDGPAEISTSKGDIRIAEATGGAVVLRTEAGNVMVDAAPGVSASLDAGTSFGRIRNTLRNSEGATAQLAIQATTAYGDITARSL